MMLHTSFRLLKNFNTGDGIDDCARLDAVALSHSLAGKIGDAKSYGLGKPIPLSVVMDHVGVQEALWALRAVYDEQRTQSSRVARTVALQAFREGQSRFQDTDQFLKRMVGIASGFLSAAEDRKALQAACQMVWNRSLSASGEMKPLYYAAWLTLLDSPEFSARSIVSALSASIPATMNSHSAQLVPRISGDKVNAILGSILASGEQDRFGPGDSSEPIVTYSKPWRRQRRGSLSAVDSALSV